ncbi:MAG: hypothetical protein ABJB12_15510 [Pseudomonadota bacterium]
MHQVSPQIARSSPRRCLLSAIAAACVLLPGPAWAEGSAPEGDTPISKAQCEDAFEQAQRLRNSFQYMEATSEALRCASAECGGVLSDECSKLYSESQAATPSVVLGARTTDGSELADVSLELDGVVRSIPLDGTPLLLDPGNHEFTFTADGFAPAKQAVVLLAGERLRPIIGVLKREASSTPTAPPPAPAETALNTSRGGPPLGSYLLGGIGLAGFAGFVGFQVAGAHDYNALERDCKPGCSQASVSAIRQKYVLSYVGLAIGAAASIAAVTVYLAAPGKPSQQAAALVVQPQPGSMTARLSVPF